MELPSGIHFPSDLSFYPDIALLVYRPRGVLDHVSVDKVIEVLGELEAALVEPFNRFIDTLEAEAVELNFRYLLNVSLSRRHSYSGRPPVKTGVLATDSTAMHFLQLHALMTHGSSIKVRIFRDRQAVADWLKISVERLL